MSADFNRLIMAQLTYAGPSALETQQLKLELKRCIDVL